MTFVIQDTTVQAAFDTLKDSIEPAAAARAMRERREYEAKRAKSQAFIEAQGTIAEREHKATLSQGYQDAIKGYHEAVERDEYYRNERNKCTLVIEAWRTCQSNFRAMAKVG